MDDIPHPPPAWEWPSSVRSLWVDAKRDHTSEDLNDKVHIKKIRKVCKEILNKLYSSGTFVQIPEIFVSDNITRQNRMSTSVSQGLKRIPLSYR